MASITFSKGSSGNLSFKEIEIPSTLNRTQQPSKDMSCTQIINLIDDFNAVIDHAVAELVNKVLTEISAFFLTDVGMQNGNVFSRKSTTRKLKMGIVQCNVSDVQQLTSGLLTNLEKEVSDIIVLKSGDTDIRSVMNRVRQNSSKKKPLVVIEQAESFDPWFLNGLFYSLTQSESDVFILFCVSTKKTIYTSIVSRRCLLSIYARSFTFAVPDEIFDLLVPDVMLWPKFTDFRFDPGFLKYLRSSFFRDNFSVSSMKKCIRFAILQHFFTKNVQNVGGEIREKFVNEVETYMGALDFLHTNLSNLYENVPVRHFSQVLQLHENIQNGTFCSSIRNSDDYKNWMQLLKNMPDAEISKVLQHRGIVTHRIQLPPKSQNFCLEGDQQISRKLSENKTTTLHLKDKLKEIISAKQRNPHTLARQKVLLDIEHMFRSVFRPFSSLAHSSDFLLGKNSTNALAPNIIRNTETSLLLQPTCPLSVAVHALMKQGKWKTVKLNKWGETFTADILIQDLEGTEEHLESVFFACVGQLERMGIIKSSKEHDETLVTITHHILNTAI